MYLLVHVLSALIAYRELHVLQGVVAGVTAEL